MRVYKTVQGDMWDSVAFTRLGSVSYTDRLMNLNREYLGYYTFPAGITLELPDKEPDAPSGQPPWKRKAL